MQYLFINGKVKTLTVELYHLLKPGLFMFDVKEQQWYIRRKSNNHHFSYLHHWSQIKPEEVPATLKTQLLLLT